MGSLTSYLQAQFAERCPRGWRCRAEVPLADTGVVRRLGFEPRADVLLEADDGSTRIWIEFEVSRADPVANHAKFATARFLAPVGDAESFVSMASRHIAPGRFALAAGTVLMMRAMGIPAFQVDLLPQFDGESVKRLNALQLDELARARPFDAAAEVDRALGAAESQRIDDEHRIHKADNAYTVRANAWQWNLEIADAKTAALWGRRPVQYFVFDPVAGLFAPSKFCAFVPAPGRLRDGLSRVTSSPRASIGMTMAVYASLGERDPRFDGHIARRHLRVNVGYQEVALDEANPGVQRAFAAWHAPLAALVPLRRPVRLLVPTRYA